MATQLDMLMAQDAGLLVPGDVPSFGSIYSDMGAASQATTDWQGLIFGGISKVVDLELRQAYAGAASSSQTPRTETGAVAGQVEGTMGAMIPVVLGGLALVLIVLALRK